MRLLAIAFLLGAYAAEPLAAADSQWVRTGITGRLIYVPDAEGDRILDFSSVGYRGRGVELIPDNVPTVAIVAPMAGDDTANIQGAIDAVSALPIVDGFRGTVLLSAGEYDIGTKVTIGASGVILRGIGRGAGETVLHGRGTGQRTLIEVLGSGSPSFMGNPKRNMIDKVVPAGASSFRVDSTAGLAVGNTVRIERPSTAAWIEAVGMDEPFDGDPAWQPDTMNIRFDRVITRIEGNRVFLDAPLASSFELQYGVGTIQRYTWPGRIENVGIENLRAESDFLFDTDEDHAWEFVSISNAQNVWVRHTTSQYFGDSAVVSNPTAKWVTIDDAINLDPKSIVTGERRYTFDLSGQLDFVTNSEANSGRHDFVNNSTRPPGPHVFHNSVANNALEDSGPHQRWATGTLFDNITVNGNNINARNRESFGTRHGWSGANMVVWNSSADGFIVQNPPTAQNWLIGSTGPVIDDMTFGPQPPGYIDSHGMPVTVGGEDSLYDAQMNDSAEIREFHWNAGNGNWVDALAWREAAVPAVYRVSTRDYLLGDIDEFTFDGNGSTDDAYIDPAWEAAISNLSALPIRGFDDLDLDKNVGFTIEHQLDAGERVVHGYLTLALRQAAAGNVSDDFVQLFDVSPVNRLNFSDLGWQNSVNSAGTFVGVIDLGASLDRLQSGSVNVLLNEDTGVDWALYTMTVATPTNDAIGPVVILDNGGIATVSAPVAGVGELEIGGNLGGHLRIIGPGRVEVNDDFVQRQDGSLTLELSEESLLGTPLFVQDQASLDGTLAVELASSFMPEFGDVFHILSTIGGIQGTFDDLQLSSMSSGLGWKITYGAADVFLQVVLAGDYNADGIIDTADYIVWRKAFGQSGINLAADGNADGEVDDDDYAIWRQHLGRSAPGGASHDEGAPEPYTFALFTIGLFWIIGLRGRTKWNSSESGH
jgi:hypothetical protein